VTGGEEGLPLDAGNLPDALVGVANTVNLYWLALAFLVVVTAVVHSIDRAPLGRVLTGLRDDERRIAVAGLSPTGSSCSPSPSPAPWPAWAAPRMPWWSAAPRRTWRRPT
jgi:hypothetical protein